MYCLIVYRPSTINYFYLSRNAKLYIYIPEIETQPITESIKQHKSVRLILKTRK